MKDYENSKAAANSSILSAPCFNCPLESQCGTDPSKFPISPAECKPILQWVLWSEKVSTPMDFLLSMKKGNKAAQAAEEQRKPEE